MYRFFAAIIAVLIAFNVSAKDSLFATKRAERLYVQHNVAAGETVFSIAKRYNVPPATFTLANSITYETELSTGQKVFIPLGTYNLLANRPASGDAIDVYYSVEGDDKLAILARYIGVQQNILLSWNNLASNTIRNGQVLLIGWLAYDKEDRIKTAANNIKVEQDEWERDEKPKETIIIIPKQKKDTIPPLQRLYLTQTNNEQIIVEEKGTAVFFPLQGKKRSATYYAFHNTVPKGRVIKVYNPGKDRTVYVKVLGPIPDAGQYHNAVIAISAAARNALDVSDERMWCELSFAP